VVNVLDRSDWGDNEALTSIIRSDWEDNEAHFSINSTKKKAFHFFLNVHLPFLMHDVHNFSTRLLSFVFIILISYIVAYKLSLDVGIYLGSFILGPKNSPIPVS